MKKVHSRNSMRGETGKLVHDAARLQARCYGHTYMSKSDDSKDGEPNDTVHLSEPESVSWNDDGVPSRSRVLWNCCATTLPDISTREPFSQRIVC